MKNKEIERKFLIDKNKIPYDLSKMNYLDITQGYVISIDKDLTYRLRHILYRNDKDIPIGEDFFQTIKGKGIKIRDEYEIRLLKEQFNVMWKLCDKLTIHKWRYEPPFDDELLFLDCYKNELSGLWTLEVEFETLEKCDKFTPPEWFGKEVTEDYTYTNLQLAINGLPEKDYGLNHKKITQ